MGNTVPLFEAMLAEGSVEYAATLRDSPPDVVVLYEDDLNFLTKMCLDRMHEAACRTVGAARPAGARVVVAGSDASDRPQALLEARSDEGLIAQGITDLPDAAGRIAQTPTHVSRPLVACLPCAGLGPDGRIPRPT